MFGALGREKRIVRVKFEAVIHPGDELDVTLERSVGSAPGETQVRFDISRDGKRLLMMRPAVVGERRPPALVVVQGWQR